MSIRHRVAAVLLVTAAAVGGLAPVAAAVPVPGEAGRHPVPVHTETGLRDGAVGVLCSGGCPQ
ncbi:hypothetical protein [Streptomyces sp. NPDC006285]|uniref:hypothetical protein n=1 Tax=Streptomyces sp. NPDC006285 TaxID=3364742 RepID=UPI00369FAC6B